MSPAGSRSAAPTPVAALGPSSDSATVNVTVSPTLGVVSSTLFAIVRSATCGVSVALAVLLFVCRSN